ncbi:MAG: extracellular solute-binding protein [Hyphomicrobiaceae bacterium]|nr:extracellular solute-binding protein [Hyphomicrobiaceae bacterium]
MVESISRLRLFAFGRSFGLGCALLAAVLSGAVRALADPLAAPTASAVQNVRSPTQHAIAMHGKPRHPADFTAFDYVNPDAPKGGRITIGVLGTYDSLNPLIVKGIPAAGLRDFVFETLLTRGLDEPFTLYGLIAERIEVAPDRSAITFHLDPRAQFSDGHAIDADDVVFSWKILRDHGRPNHRSYYKKVTRAERLTDRTVRFDLEPGDQELPLILGLMPVLPAHLIDEASFQRTSLKPPVGSGPYTVAVVDAGRSLTYARNPSWWGRDLPANKGRFNFDEVRFDYYRDDAAMFEALKSGSIDLRPEEDPARWAEGYGVDAVRTGRLRKSEFSIGLPAGMTALVFNTRRPVFADPRIRRALISLFDFGFINQSLYHGLYTRTQSYFERSELSSAGRPADARETALLAPFAADVRPEFMAGAHAFPTGDGTGRNRENQRMAFELLREAGYAMQGDGLVHTETGTPLEFEILAASAAQERLFLVFARDLQKLGIKTRIRVVDSAQYQSRLKTYDYDMIQWRWPSSLSPGNEQLFRFSSEVASREGSFNFAGVASPAVDAMIREMLAAKEADAFVSAVRALDRLLLSGDYVIPLFHLEKQWVAHSADLVPPARTSLFGYQIDTWWHASASSNKAELK